MYTNSSTLMRLQHCFTATYYSDFTIIGNYNAHVHLFVYGIMHRYAKSYLVWLHREGYIITIEPGFEYQERLIVRE